MRLGVGPRLIVGATVGKLIVGGAGGSPCREGVALGAAELATAAVDGTCELVANC